MTSPTFDPASCPDADILQAYIDNDLPPDEYVEVLDHTSTCPHCQAYLAHATHTLAVLAGIGQEPVHLPPLDESYARFIKHAPADLHLGGSEPSPWLDTAEMWGRRAAQLLGVLPRPSRRHWAMAGAGLAAAAATGLYLRHRHHRPATAGASQGPLI